MLEKRGHRVLGDNNGHEVLDALAKDMFDLVLMDLQMPEIDGFQATTEIREKAKGTGRHQIVIAVGACHERRSGTVPGSGDGWLSG
jgi:two-component system sensor histidine kinase/response regulator